MKKNALGLLRCPVCTSKLELTAHEVIENEDNIISGKLHCKKCDKIYNINKGIPLMFDTDSPNYEIKKTEMDGWIKMYRDQGQYGTDDEGDRVSPYLDRSPGRKADELWKAHAQALDYLLENVEWQDKLVLEIGACRCWLGRWLAERDAKYIGSDLLVDDLIGLGRADFYYREYGLYLDRVQGDGEMLPFSNATFDATIIISSLHHTTNLHRMVSEMCRVTKRGGYIFVLNEGFKPIGDRSNVTPEQKKEKEMYGTNENVFSVPRYIFEFMRCGVVPYKLTLSGKNDLSLRNLKILLMGWGGLDMSLRKIFSVNIIERRNTSMKILCSTLRYYPAIGGAEVVLQNVCERLSKKGFTFNVLATTAMDLEEIFYRKETQEKKEIINGIEVSRSPITNIPMKPLIAKISDKLTIYGHGAYSYLQFKKLLHEECDLILSMPFPSTHNYYTFLAAKIRNKPIVLCPLLHLEDKYHSHRKSLFFMLKHADAVIALTDYEKEFYIRQKVDGSKIRVIGVGVDPESFPKKESGIKDKYNATNLITFIGRKEEYKGIATILKALRLLIKQMPNLRFLCIGPETSYSKELWKNLPQSIRNNVIIKQNVSEEEKKAILPETDIFVMPSTAESFGIVYIEAWMYETPVIGARSGAISDVISEYEDGFLIEPGNYVELAVKIRYLLENEEVAKEFGRNGKKKVLSKYTWNIIADKWKTVFEEVVK